MSYIVKAYRSAVGKAGRGGFSHYRSDDLAVDVINFLMSQVPELDPSLIDDVIVGCANPEGEQGLQIGRLISMRALGKEVPGMTINRYCASGLEAISIASAKIKAGMGRCYIAGGTESMSMIPMTGYKFAPNYKVASTTPDYLVSMGATAEAVANKYDISREDSDAFAYRSHSRAANAIDNGYFKEEIVPIKVENVLFKDGKKVNSISIVDTDEGVRRDTSVEALGKL
ncbi:MAG: thiolase family protein, partial [Saprospiraceae bacterium]